ncbi:MAG: hypothetical protein PHU47_03060 [Candidatus ainarchaeum sp.]|nr:hypothetical protein [Candidatus ainarchaeum sp.]
MLFKRSISPLIATILLIVVSVILITVVLTWAKGFTQSTTNKATDLLDQSKEIPRTGVFWQTSLLGDQLILRNQISDDIEIKGYKISSTDYNSDYFWLNSYRPLETNITFSPSTLTPITLVCVPTNKFYLELIDINDQSYTLEINPTTNRSFTSCNTFNVPLWEFETINGSYLISEFEKTKPNNFFTDVGMGISGNVVNIDENTWSFTSDGSTSTFISNGGISYTLGRKYKVEMETLSSSGIIGDDQLYFQRFSLGSNYLDDNDVPIKEVGRHTLTIWCNRESSSYFQLQLNSSTNANIVIRIDSITEIDPLETITDGTNYLENLTAGRKVILSSQAYGSWEFDLYKGNNANPRVQIISNNTSAYNSFLGYMLYIYQDTKVIHFTMSTGSGGSALMVTNSDFVKDLFWYNVKITRDRNNEFTFLIKGPFFTPTPGYDGWTLVSLSSGLNPRVNSNYTTSNYFVIDLDPGDRIANIKLTPEIN